MRRRRFAIASSLLVATLACGPDAPPEEGPATGAGDAPTGDSAASTRADSILAAWIEAGRIPGAVLRVTRGGAVVHERAYGHAALHDYGAGQYGAWEGASDAAGAGPGTRRLAEPVPMTPGTVFDLASVTKVMATTLALMVLVDEGSVDLDAPVRTYLPDFRGGGKAEVTVRQLLTHTGGLAQWVPTYYHAEDADAAYRHVRDLPLSWDPGAERRYSDLGFMVLGRVVEAVAGAPLDRFTYEAIYGPLGLQRTGFRPAPSADGRTPGTGVGVPDGPFAATSHGNPFEHRMVHDSTFGYRIQGDPNAWNGWRRHTLVGEVNDGNAWHAFRGVAGHAGLFSTAADLSVLLEVLLAGGEADGLPLIAPGVVEEFLLEHVDGQALGWQVPSWAPPGSFAHTGFTGTYVLGVPEQGLSLVLLTNRQNVGVGPDGGYADVDPLRRAVARAFLGDDSGVLGVSRPDG